MRRAVSALLSVLFSLWLITPAFSAPAATDHPACCKRGGKHHCTMGQSTTDGPTLAGARCSQYQWQGSTVVPQIAGLTALVQRAQISYIVSALPRSERAFVSSLAVDATSSRGPPQL